MNFHCFDPSTTCLSMIQSNEDLSMIQSNEDPFHALEVSVIGSYLYDWSLCVKMCFQKVYFSGIGKRLSVAINKIIHNTK